MNVSGGLPQRAEIVAAALNLDGPSRRELALTLLWSLPRNEVIDVNQRLFHMMQKDIVGLLPSELTMLILANLDIKDLLSCCLVSRTWARRINDQSLWGRLCAAHLPTIVPAEATWADLSLHRQLLHLSNHVAPASPYVDDDSDDNVEMELLDVLKSQGGLGGGGGVASHSSPRPGMRRSVWERSSSTLPTHIRYQSSRPAPVPSTMGHDHSSLDEPPILSHLPLPAPHPQVNFKHLHLVHDILSRRMRGLSPLQLSSLDPTPRGRIGRPRVPAKLSLDAITSIEAGGLPGHSECVYALELIHRPMKISLAQVCGDSTVPPPPSPFDGFMNLTSSRGSRRASHPGFSSSSTQTQPVVVNGNEWLLTGSRDNTLRLWQLACTKPRVVKIFHGGHTGSVLAHCVVEVPIEENRRESGAVEFGPSPLKSYDSIGKQKDGKTRIMAVSSGSDGKICLWDVEHGDGTPDLVCQAHEDSVLCVKGDDERVVSCSKDKTIRLFTIKDLQETLVIHASSEEGRHRGAVNAVGLSKEYIVSGSGDKTVRVWDIHTGSLLAAVEAHSRGIASVAFSSQPSPYSSFEPKMGYTYKGTIITGSADASIRTFHLLARSTSSFTSVRTVSSELVPPMEDLTFREMLDTEHDVDMSPINSDHDELVLDKGPICWASCICPQGTRVEGRSCGRCFNRGHTDLVRSLHLGEEVILSGSYDSTVKVWDRKSGSLLLALAGAHSGRVFAVTGDRRKIVSSGFDCRITIWDFSEGLDTSFVRP
ncbi:hypothetical protein TREMEDRAFT_59082 [Tremella mesenterica DSM 1558]|uniref:uncharacterized protein n=1 Tax=Tremella mesenterica (strain ATCC 24925 / CBS 8224 / DSM 1558 / NBRC 9311 / NRRL Y-6157 / RJB 2259-6 / UBC 559-6) TaxID=578456 RepID=UPI0003F49288|nr:uncharacterized protein TREMEDRAFT_59082 [Tremella mesenterica DSM 1558]EIW72921.1 hypothetical protein TREMEDRAFT_59082 [Tremella mesenterica DSM 1558]